MVGDRCNGVVRDVERDVRLYERAIDECVDATSMFNLAIVLEEGRNGTVKAVKRSKCL